MSFCLACVVLIKFIEDLIYWLPLSNILMRFILHNLFFICVLSLKVYVACTVFNQELCNFT